MIFEESKKNFLSWLKLGWSIGNDAGIALAMVIPIAFQTPFYSFYFPDNNVSKDYFNAAGFLTRCGHYIYQVITYGAVYPSLLIGKYCIGPAFGILSSVFFLFPAVYGCFYQKEANIKKFDWFTTHARQYGALYIWTPLILSSSFTILFLLGYIDNRNFIIPFINASLTAFELTWILPISLVLSGICIMGSWYWLKSLCHAKSSIEVSRLPILSTIDQLALTPCQKQILNKLFVSEHEQQEHNRLINFNPLFSNHQLLREQLDFAKEMQSLTDETFNRKVNNRKRLIV